MKGKWIFIFVSFITNVAWSQNYVLNGGFEEFSRCPNELGDFYPLKWLSVALNASPDLYSYCAREGGSAHPNWFYSGVKPFKDSSYVGIVVEDKRTTYRESLRTKLRYKLRKDSVYVFEISIAIPIISRYTIESLDVIISKSSVYGHDGYTIIERLPSFSINLDSLKTDGSWASYKFEYTAIGGEAHLSIGNFKSKKKTVISKIENRNETYYRTIYNSSYLCLDDVKIYRLNESFAEPQGIASEKKMSPIILDGIQFQTGSAQIENDNIPQLEEIADLLLQNERMTIEIIGYTDNIGLEDENILLSKQRALNVKRYLLELGVVGSRITAKGNGSENPIGDNNTQTGRLLNRRIEVLLTN